MQTADCRPDTKCRLGTKCCARVGWCDAFTDFTNVIKVDVDVDVNETSRTIK